MLSSSTAPFASLEVADAFVGALVVGDSVDSNVGDTVYANVGCDVGAPVGSVSLHQQFKVVLCAIRENVSESQNECGVSVAVNRNIATRSTVSICVINVCFAHMITAFRGDDTHCELGSIACFDGCKPTDVLISCDAIASH